MQFITPLWPAYPEIFLLGMVCVILVADLFVTDDNRVVTTHSLRPRSPARSSSSGFGGPHSRLRFSTCWTT